MTLLKFADEEPFAMGAATYVVSGENEEEQRVTVNVEIEGLSTMAILDTGAPYSICEPELAKEINFDPSEAIRDTTISTWAGEIKGSIYRANFSLMADDGESLFLDAPVFVPDLEGQDFAPDFPPSFIGWIGCLQSIRFAVDPSSDTFYFMQSPR